MIDFLVGTFLISASILVGLVCIFLPVEIVERIIDGDYFVAMVLIVMTMAWYSLVGLALMGLFWH